MRLSVHPFGKIIDVEAGANLLDCLKGAGIPISYSCQDGRCKMCRCRVLHLSGAVGGGASASARTPSKRLDDITQDVLACQIQLVGDCAVQVPVAGLPVVHSQRKLRARITAKRLLCASVVEVTAIPMGNLRFSPGQHIEVEFREGLRRCYSLASAPGNKKIQFHARLHIGGEASEYIANSLRIGDYITLNGPLGSAYLRAPPEEGLLLLGAQVGLSPILSILRSLANQQMRSIVPEIIVVLAFLSPKDVYAQDELARALDDVPSARIRLMVLGTRGGPVNDTAIAPMGKGMLTDWLREEGRDLRLGSWRAYVFGTFSAVEATVRLLNRSSMKGDNIHAEPFYPSSFHRAGVLDLELGMNMGK